MCKEQVVTCLDLFKSGRCGAGTQTQSWSCPSGNVWSPNRRSSQLGQLPNYPLSISYRTCHPLSLSLTVPRSLTADLSLRLPKFRAMSMATAIQKLSEWTLWKRQRSKSLCSCPLPRQHQAACGWHLTGACVATSRSPKCCERWSSASSVSLHSLHHFASFCIVFLQVRLRHSRAECARASGCCIKRSKQVV